MLFHILCGIPWFTCVKILWFFSWFLCFKISWYTMVSMVCHGILPWFTYFKTPWYLPWNTMVYFCKVKVRLSTSYCEFKYTPNVYEHIMRRSCLKESNCEG